MLELLPEVPSTAETLRALRLVLEKPGCLEVWHVAQGQHLHQGRVTRGVLPGDKPISNFCTMIMPS